MRAWRAADALRGARGAARRGCTASPPTSASTCCRGPQRRARPMDLGPSLDAADTLARRAAAREHVGRARSPTAVSCATDGDPAEVAAVARDDPAGLRGRAPAPAAPPARRADPARGAALAGHRGGRAARHDASPRSTARCSGPGPRSTPSTSTPSSTRRAADVDDEQQRAARPLRRRLRALRHRRAASRCCTRTPTFSMPPYALWLRGPTRSHVDARPGHRVPRARGCCRRAANGCPAFGVYRPTPATACHRRSRCRPRGLRRPDHGDPQLPRPRPPPVRPARAPRGLRRRRRPAAAPGRSAHVPRRGVRPTRPARCA